MKYLLKIALFTISIVLVTITTYSQPKPGGNPESSGEPTVGGGSASIGGGLVLLLIMSTTYGVCKYKRRINVKSISNLLNKLENTNKELII